MTKTTVVLALLILAPTVLAAATPALAPGDVIKRRNGPGGTEEEVWIPLAEARTLAPDLPYGDGQIAALVYYNETSPYETRSKLLRLHRASDLALYATYSWAEEEETDARVTITPTWFVYEEPCMQFPWPMEVGREETQTCELTTRVEGQEPSTTRFSPEARVLREEEVTVPAGTFQAFVVEDNGGMRTYWYAPSVCGIVKSVAKGYQGAPDLVSEATEARCASGGAAVQSGAIGGAAGGLPWWLLLLLALLALLGLVAAVVASRKKKQKDQETK